MKYKKIKTLLIGIAAVAATLGICEITTEKKENTTEYQEVMSYQLVEGTGETSTLSMVFQMEAAGGQAVNFAPTATPTPTPTPSPTPTPTATPTPSPTLTSTPKPTATPTPLPAIEELVTAALMINCTENKVVYAYQEQNQLPPASVTKLMTALLALEHGNLEDILTTTETALDVGDTDASMCGFKLGDKAKLRELLYGLMLPSGNEAAEMIGEYLAGDVESFVKMMNAKAAELGMESTNFCNPHGLPNDEHLTTADDISVLMKALFAYDDFFEIAAQAEYEITYWNAAGKEVTKKLKHTNHYMNGRQQIPEGITILGSKTGYTKKAGRCLVMFVEAADGTVYIVELFGAKDTTMLYMAMNQLLDKAGKE